MMQQISWINLHRIKHSKFTKTSLVKADSEYYQVIVRHSVKPRYGGCLSLCHKQLNQQTKQVQFNDTVLPHFPTDVNCSFHNFSIITEFNYSK